MKNDLAKWIRKIIEDFGATGKNSLMNPQNEPAWDKPLVGFAKGNDPLWDEYKKHIGDFYWTPQEIFGLAFPSSPVKPDEITVISWILPQTKQTKLDQRKETSFPSERWARSRKYGEEYNVKLRSHLVKTLAREGFAACAPLLLPQWKMESSEHYGLASSWSERHAAYAAGLGTFGLCDGLITPLGKAIRCGSVVAQVTIEPTSRPYQDHHAYCLFYTQGTCGKCIDRCPVEAITKKGHDKSKCQRYVDIETRTFINTQFGFDAYGCGLCQVEVPCESQIPVKTKVDKR
jgi:epoxyqueuosine reductase QueG